LGPILWPMIDLSISGIGAVLGVAPVDLYRLIKAL
jgi:hypothetical protein